MSNPEIFSSYPKSSIYLDSLSRGIQPQESIDAQNEKANGSIIRTSLHTSARKSTEDYLQDMKTISDFLKVDEEKLSILPNPDLAWNIMLRSLCEVNPIQKLYLDIFDHHSILAPAIGLAPKYGYEIVWMEGFEDYNKLKHSTGKDLFLFNHVSPVLGDVKRLKQIINVKRDTGISLAIDASLTVLQHGIGFNYLDFVVIDGSVDLLGPLGATIFYSSHNLPSSFYGSSLISNISRSKVDLVYGMEKFEVGMPNLTALHGLATSVRYVEKLGIDRIREHRSDLHKAFLSAFSEADLPGYELVEPKINFQNSQVFSIKVPQEISSHDVALMLDEIHHISVRSGKACSYMGLEKLGIDEVLQISTHIYNSIEELKLFIEKLSEVSKMF